MKSHFQFSNQQRNGIFLLLIILVGLQCIYLFGSKSENEPICDDLNLQHYRKELDSLRLVEIENNEPKIYPFNPNYITDYKGYTLGMSNEEIDRLHKFRALGHWVNSPNEFQDITKVSDSLLAKISPYFKFPEWVTNPKSKTNSFKKSYPDFSQPKSFDQKIDLNKATAIQLQKIYGIGEKLSQRIIDYDFG